MNVVWRQASVPSSGKIVGFQSNSSDAAAASSFASPTFGAACSGFQGLGASSDVGSCVLDGNGASGCFFSCLGLQSDFSLGGVSGIPGPLSKVARAYTFSIMAVPPPPAPAAGNSSQPTTTVLTTTNTTSTTTTSTSTTTLAWVLLGKQDVDKCLFNKNATGSASVFDQNTSADCFMAISSQNWTAFLQPDWAFVFRLTWTDRNNQTTDLLWRQQSPPSAGSITGFRPLNSMAQQASSYVNPLYGKACSAFAGLGRSQSTSPCMFDGNAASGCFFSCVGLQQSTTFPSPGSGSALGPLGIAMKSFSFWVMQAPQAPLPATSTSTTGTVTSTTSTTSETTTTTDPPKQVTMSLDLNVDLDDPNAFVSNPNTTAAIIKAFASQLPGVPLSAIQVTLDVIQSVTNPPTRRLNRRLGLASAVVRVGVTVAAQSAANGASNSASRSASSTTPAGPTKSPAASLASSMVSISPSVVTEKINGNLQASSGSSSAPVVKSTAVVMMPTVGVVPAPTTVVPGGPTTSIVGWVILVGSDARSLSVSGACLIVLLGLLAHP